MEFSGSYSVPTHFVEEDEQSDDETRVDSDNKHLIDDDQNTDSPQPFLVRMFPTGFKYELVELLKYSWPMVATMFCNTFIRLTASIMSGHLGKLELDAVSMAVSIANVIGTSIGIGLIAACDTLFSQSFGSINQKQVGIYFQTAIYISSLSCVISWGILFNTNSILLLLGQDPSVALLTEKYLYYFMPALYFLFMYQLLARYLQVQSIVIPPLIAGLLANVINIIVQYILVYPVNMGITGSAISQLLGYLLLAGLLAMYTVITKVYEPTWGGWTRLALQDWGEFMKLGISSILMICLEWWTFEVSMFVMGILGQTELGANAILYQLWVLYSSISLGIGAACAYRIGRYLGAKRHRGAVTVARVAICGGFFIGIIMAIITMALRWQLPYIFSSDPDVVQLSGEMVPILCIFVLFGTAKNICAGVVRGTGRQVAGGIVSFISYFVIALPIGLPLMFLTDITAAGFWWGLCIGLVCASVSLLFIVLKMDWQDEVQKAQVRAKVKPRKHRKSEMVDRDRHPSNYSTITEETDALFENGMAPKVSGSNEVVYQSYGSVGTDNVKSFQLASSTKMVKRYWRTLYIKRFFTMIICFLLMVFGIICRFVFFIPPPLPMVLNTTMVTLLPAELYENFTLLK